MSIWLEILVTLTIAGSTVVASMLLLRQFLSHAFTARWQYLIGKTALLFYLLPVVSIIQRLPLPQSEVISGTKILTTDLGNAIASSITYFTADIGLTMFIIWAVGAVVFSVWHIYCFCIFNIRIKRSSFPVPHNSDIAKLVTAYQRNLGISGNVKLAYNSKIGSPILVGLFKPTILLPSDNMTGSDLGMVIHHELIHLKRRDLWVKLLVLIASAIHWFNPCVHRLRKDIHIWSELSCDEEVVQEMSHAERKRYGETILNLLDNATEIPAAYTASLSESGVQLKQRLSRLLHAKRSSRYTVAITFALVIAIGGLGTTTAAWAAKYIPPIHLTMPEVQVSEYTTPIVHEEHVKWATDLTSKIKRSEENLGRLQLMEIPHIEIQRNSEVTVTTEATTEVIIEEVFKASPTRIKLKE